MEENKSVRLMNAFMDVRRKIKLVIGSEELTKCEYKVLQRIKIERENNAENQGRIKIVKISEYLSIAASAISKIIISLEQKGLIERKYNAVNRRIVIIEVTERGERSLQQGEDRINIFIDKLTAEIGENKADELLRLLEKTIVFCEKEKNLKGNEDY